MIKKSKRQAIYAAVFSAFEHLELEHGYFVGWCDQPHVASVLNTFTYHVFFHDQDADDLKETGRLYLAWGGDGNLIVRVLQEHGLSVEWDGFDDHRILVTGP